MDRKKFLQLTSTGAMAGMALAAFPNVLSAKTEPRKLSLEAWWNRSENIDILLELYTEGITDFESVVEKYRHIELTLRKVYFDENGDEDSYDELFYSIYKLKTAPVLKDEENNIYKTEAIEMDRRGDETNLDLSSALPLEIKFKYDDVVTFIYVGIKFSNRLISFKAAEDTCFLTSACTQAKGLPDNCIELETLRAFRNDYMSHLAIGQQLIQEYAVVGPAVVRQIDSRPNAMEMYASIYDSLVLPSIDLINKNRKKDAMHFYKKYVEGLNNLLA